MGEFTTVILDQWGVLGLSQSFIEKFQRKYLADALAAKFQMDANKRDEALLTADVPDDDLEANLSAQVAFLQRMVPIWFMRPFTSKSGGAIEQGNANESQVIRVLRNKVKKMSSGLYDIGKVEEFGLLANLCSFPAPH